MASKLSKEARSGSKAKCAHKTKVVGWVHAELLFFEGLTTAGVRRRGRLRCALVLCLGAGAFLLLGDDHTTRPLCFLSSAVVLQAQLEEEHDELSVFGQSWLVDAIKLKTRSTYPRGNTVHQHPLEVVERGRELEYLARLVACKRGDEVFCLLGAER